MRASKQGNAYLLYCGPQPGHLSGHMAYVVTKPDFVISADNLHTLKNGNIDYYFSMYPNPQPSLIKKLVKTFSFKAVEPIMAPSYEHDLLMRGNSRDRYSKGIRTDLTTKEYYALTEPLKGKQRQQRFLLGQYTHAIKLPDNFDQNAAKATLDIIRESRLWTAYAPGVKYVPCARQKAKLAHNCSSAVVSALQAGGMTNITPHFRITPANNTMRNAFWLSYFAILLMRFTQIVSSELNADKLLLIPMAYALFRLALAANHSRTYFSMMRQMHPTPNNLPTALNVGLSTALLAMNTSVFHLTPAAAAHFFNFPLQVFKAVQRQPGVQAIEANTPSPAELEAPPATDETSGSVATGNTTVLRSKL